MIKEGSGGAAFYVIESGEATVTIGGEQRARLKAEDYFGEIALIDEGARTATITASTELVCYGLTLWEFRPLVEENGVIGWKLLQTLAKELRATEKALASLRSPLSGSQSDGVNSLASSPPIDLRRQTRSERTLGRVDMLGVTGPGPVPPISTCVAEPTPLGYPSQVGQAGRPCTNHAPQVPPRAWAEGKVVDLTSQPGPDF